MFISNLKSNTLLCVEWHWYREVHFWQLDPNKVMRRNAPNVLKNCSYCTTLHPSLLYYPYYRIGII